MNQALYRKYRSKSFDEVVGQEHITDTLKKAIASGRISHAYLFTGPRGVGKTSVARILAHAVNELPYEGESIHLDIIEIDAASNRRIDEVRDLRDKVNIAPTAAKYKVYIIDEVHMLTREAFNALLKTLEEPPAHCIFVLATTEAHKLPETIISRTQRFEFKPISTAQAAEHLKNIAKKEKIEVSPETLNLLAEFGKGSFRDSISYLDQLGSGDKRISEQDVRNILGLPSDREIDSILASLGSGDSSELLKNLQAVKEKGVDAEAIANTLSKRLREKIINTGTTSGTTDLLKKLIDVPASARPYDYLEISLLEASSGNDMKEAASNIELPTPEAESDKPKTSSKTAAAKIPSTVSPDLIIDIPNNQEKEAFGMNNWEDVITNVKEKAASIYTALKLAKPELSGSVLTLKFQFPLHQKKIDNARNKGLIAGIIEDLTGNKITIICEVDKSVFGPSAGQSLKEVIPLNNKGANPIHSINNVFGGVEVLET